MSRKALLARAARAKLTPESRRVLSYQIFSLPELWSDMLVSPLPAGLSWVSSPGRQAGLQLWTEARLPWAQLLLE